MDTHGSCAEKIHLGQFAVICIQYKDSYSWTCSFNAEAFFLTVDTMAAALHFKSLLSLLLIVAYNDVGFVFAAFSLSFVIALHWLQPI